MFSRFIPHSRRDGPRAPHVVFAWVVFTVGYALFRDYCGASLHETRFGAYWWLPPAAFGLLAWLHHRTAGRSSPSAALAFVLVGPVLGVGILVPWAYKERRRFESAGVVQQLSLADALAMAHTMGCIALLAACVAAIVHAAFTYDEWIGPHVVLAPPRATAHAGEHAPFFLAELGLDRSASLADLDRVYRKLARRLHPDRGGATADFKRLQASYEKARRYLSDRDARRTHAAPADTT